jgi:hypothetical protein
MTIAAKPDPVGPRLPLHCCGDRHKHILTPQTLRRGLFPSCCLSFLIYGTGIRNRSNSLKTRGGGYV